MRPRASSRTTALSRLLCLLPAAGLVLSGCAAAVSVEPARDAADPACAPVMLALPDELGDQPVRKTTSQATAAWGDPSSVVLRCGVKPPAPTTERCVTVNEVDWVIRRNGDDTAGTGTGTSGGDDGGDYTLITYGRSPAVEVLLDSSRVSSATVLASLSGPVSKIVQKRGCVGLSDAQPAPSSPAAGG